MFYHTIKVKTKSFSFLPLNWLVNVFPLILLNKIQLKNYIFHSFSAAAVTSYNFIFQAFFFNIRIFPLNMIIKKNNKQTSRTQSPILHTNTQLFINNNPTLLLFSLDNIAHSSCNAKSVVHLSS